MQESRACYSFIDFFVKRTIYNVKTSPYIPKSYSRSIAENSITNTVGRDALSYPRIRCHFAVQDASSFLFEYTALRKGSDKGKMSATFMLLEFCCYRACAVRAECVLMELRGIIGLISHSFCSVPLFLPFPYLSGRLHVLARLKYEKYLVFVNNSRNHWQCLATLYVEGKMKQGD